MVLSASRRDDLGRSVSQVLCRDDIEATAGEYLAAALALAVSMLSVEFAAPIWGPLWAFSAGSSGLALLMKLSRGPLAGAVLDMAWGYGDGDEPDVHAVARECNG